MGQGRPPGTTVFVGNISYDTTEQELKEVFSQVGPVLKFRPVYDNQTGRAKGYGFCEYEDKETAMSARRNLNGTMVNGRPLRVDLTDNDKQLVAANGLSLPDASNDINQKNDADDSGGKGLGLGPLRATGGNHGDTNAGPILPASLANANPSMASMSLPEIHQTMIHLKKAIVQHPNEMRELLTANPRLAHAILQGQVMLGMIPSPLMPTPTPGAGIPPSSNIPAGGVGLGGGPPVPPPSQQPTSIMPVDVSLPGMGAGPPVPITAALSGAGGGLMSENINNRGPPPPPSRTESQPQLPLSGPSQSAVLPPTQTTERPILPPRPPPSMQQQQQQQGLRPTPPPPQQGIRQQTQSVPSPVQQGLRQQPPPPSAGAPPVLPSQQQGTLPQGETVDEQTAILSRVINLTQQEIDELAPEYRQYVFQLKQIVGMNNVGGAQTAQDPQLQAHQAQTGGPQVPPTAQAQPQMGNVPPGGMGPGLVPQQQQSQPRQPFR